MSEKKSKLDSLKKKKEQLDARIKKLETLQKARERKRDTRRKILVSACFMEQATEEGNLDSLFKQLDGYLKRNSDRELFCLERLHNEKKSEPNETIEEI